MNKKYQLLATLDSGGTPTYHHPDHLSIRVNSDTAGTAVGQQGHYPFGESWYSQSTTTKWQFTSYERDPESSLDYAIFRYDSSRLGRFQTPDPIGGSLLDPQSLNRYSYVLNDPINFIDPLGLLTCTFDGAWIPCEFIGHLLNSPLTFLAPDGYVQSRPGGPWRIPGTDFTLDEDDWDWWFGGFRPGGSLTGPLKERLAELLANPKCAQLVGGAANAKELLDKLNVYNVDRGETPPLTPSNIRQMIAFDTTQPRANTQESRGAPILVGREFDALTPNEKLITVIHEFRHQIKAIKQPPSTDPGLDKWLENEEDIIDYHCIRKQ